jgi:hypothetical protein
MTGLGKTREEVGAMPFCDVSDILSFWRKNPPAHILLAIVAQDKVWKPRDESREPQMMDAGMAQMVGRNRLPAQALPQDVKQMFADIQSGKMPGMAPIEP